MKRFLIKLAQLLLLTIVALACVVFYKQQDHNYSSKKMLFEANKGQTSGLILGTSHTNYGINPRLFPFNVINIGERNKPIEVDIEIVEKYIDQLPNLKYVFIPIDYFTLYYTGSNEPFPARYYHHWNLKNGYLNSYTFKRYHVFNCGFLIPESEDFKDKATLGYLAKHDNLTSLSEAQKITNCKERIDMWKQYWIDTSSTPYIYKRIIDLGMVLKKKKITPIFVTMPVSAILYNYYDTTILSKNDLLLNQIITTTGGKYVNLQNNPVFKADSLFNDIDHLNDKGATIATNIIKDALH